MKAISIRELHERTGAWVRKAVEIGAITVTGRGKPVVWLEPVSQAKPRTIATCPRPGISG